MTKKIPLKFNKDFVNKAEIARKLGVSRPYIQLLFTGQRNNPKMIAKIKALIKEQLRTV
jgi:transcriptional regulator with XRE-family HTH domain